MEIDTDKMLWQVVDCKKLFCGTTDHLPNHIRNKVIVYVSTAVGLSITRSISESAKNKMKEYNL